MNAISLFSGVGMFDLGVSLAGFNIVAQVEIDEFCRRVLNRHAPSYWPDSKQFADVRQFGAGNIDQPVDLIFGGFPCQPFSGAGKQLGASDSRNLWPEFKRIIGELRPRAVLLENVTRITQTYKVEGELRPAYALTVIADLASMGYDAQWGIISAADCGAPHNRKRWWCVAYANRERRQESSARQSTYHQNGEYPAHQQAGQSVLHATEPGRQSLANSYRQRQSQQKRRKPTQRRRTINRRKAMGNTQNQGLSVRQQAGGLSHQTQARKGVGINRPQRPVRRVTQSRMGRAAHGVATRVDIPDWPSRPNIPQHEWEAPRTVPPRTVEDRTSRIKALGNGGIWVIAYQLAKEIKQKIGQGISTPS